MAAFLILSLTMGHSLMAIAGTNFTVGDGSGQWAKIDETHNASLELYKNNNSGPQNFVFTKSLKIRGPSFTRYLRQNLNEVEMSRARLLSYYGIAKYSIVNHAIKKSTVKGFAEMDQLEIRYLDLDGKYRMAIERQYVRGTRAFIVTYVEESQVLSSADLNRINGILDRFAPKLSRVAGFRVYSIEQLASLFLEPAIAETEGGASPISAPPPSSSLTRTDSLDMSSEPLPPICNDVPVADRRKTLRAENVKLSDFSGCGPAAWASLAKIYKELEAIDDATTSDHIGQTLASVGSGTISRFVHPIDTAKKMVVGIINFVKEKAKATNQFLNCLNAKASISELCAAAPKLAETVLVGAGVGKVASAAAEELAASRIAGIFGKGAVKEGEASAVKEAPAAANIDLSSKSTTEWQDEVTKVSADALKNPDPEARVAATARLDAIRSASEDKNLNVFGYADRTMDHVVRNSRPLDFADGQSLRDLETKPTATGGVAPKNAASQILNDTDVFRTWDVANQKAAYRGLVEDGKLPHAQAEKYLAADPIESVHGLQKLELYGFRQVKSANGDDLVFQNPRTKSIIRIRQEKGMFGEETRNFSPEEQKAIADLVLNDRQTQMLDLGSSVGRRSPRGPSTQTDPYLKALDENQGGNRYKARFQDGKANVKIGYMENTMGKEKVAPGAGPEAAFIYLHDAVRAGKVAEINAGNVMGPRVLAILNRLKDEVPDGENMIVHGKMEPADLALTFNRQLNLESANPKMAAKIKSDKAKFERALDELGITKACRQFYNAPVSKCKDLIFQIDSHSPNGIRWQPL